MITGQTAPDRQHLHEVRQLTCLASASTESLKRDPDFAWAVSELKRVLGLDDEYFTRGWPVSNVHDAMTSMRVRQSFRWSFLSLAVTQHEDENWVQRVSAPCSLKMPAPGGTANASLLTTGDPIFNVYDFMNSRPGFNTSFP